MARPSLNRDSLVLVLLGKTGTGKSTLGNELVGKLVFEAKGGPVSRTEHCSDREGFCADHRLLIVDTPGTMDVKNPQRAIAEIRRAIDSCPEGVDAFLVVVNWSAKFTVEEASAIEVAVNVFGRECYKRTIVVFSHVDQNTMADFENNLRQVRAQLPRLDQMLNKLCNRYCPMDNGQLCPSEMKQQQLRNLIDQCDSVSSSNPVRYRRMELEKEQRRQKAEKRRLEKKKRQEEEEKNRRERETQQKIADLERQLNARPSTGEQIGQIAANMVSSVLSSAVHGATQTFVQSAMQNRSGSNIAPTEPSLQPTGSSNPAVPRRLVPVSNSAPRRPSLQTMGSSNWAGSNQPESFFNSTSKDPFKSIPSILDDWAVCPTQSWVSSRPRGMMRLNYVLQELVRDPTILTSRSPSIGGFRFHEV